MAIRNLLLDDIGFAIDLVLKEGWLYNKVELERMLAMDPRGSFLYEEDEPLGFITCVTYRTTAVIGHLVVSERARGKKIGKNLLSKAIEYASDKEMDSILLFATEEGVEVYKRQGFRTLAEVLCIRAHKDGTVTPPEHPDVSSLSDGDIDQVARIDAELFGDDRSRLIAALFHEYPHLCYKIERDGKLQGYAFGRSTSSANDFGPWVCVSGLESDARALLGSVVSRFDERDVFLGAFAQNELAVRLASVLKPVRVWNTRLMVHGQPRYTDRVEQFLGLVGFELG